MYTNEEIVEKIRELAKKKNTSLTDIEKNLAWSNGRIGKWKYAKKYPPKQDLELVARALKVSIETITGGQREKPASTSGDELEEAIIIGRDGKKIKRTYTKDQMDALRKIIDVMPFVNDEEIFDGSLDDF